MELFDLTGKVAVITGSTKGTGRAIAEQMALHGAKVVISSRKADACEAVSAEINDRLGGDRAIAVPANISRKEDLEGLVARAREAYGKIDILVCNAASNPYRREAETPRRRDAETHHGPRMQLDRQAPICRNPRPARSPAGRRLTIPITRSPS